MIKSKLEEAFGTKEKFEEAAAALDLNEGNCMLVAGLKRVCFAGYLGNDPTTDFEGVGTVNSDRREEYRRITELSCVSCGQCVAIVDAGEYANVSMGQEVLCPPAVTGIEALK